MSGEFEDPLAPVFFLSYARARKPNRSTVAPYEVDAQGLRLYEHLSLHVNELVAIPPGRDPGFLDRTLDSGEQWEAQLLRAAGTCQVFVPLMSVAYPGRKWCQMEWDLFTRRKVVRRSDGQPSGETAIVPVLWSPIDLTRLPEPIQAVQSFSPRGLPDDTITPLYHANGLYGLLVMGAKVEYQAVVWKLAQRVAEIYYHNYVEPLQLPTSEGLGRLWTTGGGR